MVVVKEMFMEPVVEENVEVMKVENPQLNIIKMDSLIMLLSPWWLCLSALQSSR